MPWTEITRLRYERRGQRYASDSTDEEWAPRIVLPPPWAGAGYSESNRLSLRTKISFPAVRYFQMHQTKSVCLRFFPVSPAKYKASRARLGEYELFHWVP